MWHALVSRCLPKLAAAGIPVSGELRQVLGEQLCELWGGMGAIVELQASFSSGERRSLVAKTIDMPAAPKSTSERRKKASYEIEARFYERGHAERLIAAGAPCPFPLHVDWALHEGRLTVCMTRLAGAPVRSMSSAQVRMALTWLARLHALYWGSRADEAVAEGSVQEQGCYWHLDTRLEELERWTDESGFEGRLRRAARAIDARLKEDRHQTVCHGDAKSENMLFSKDGVAMFDFQYVGKASPAKDLAYCLISSRDEVAHLEFYLTELRRLLRERGLEAPSLDELRVAYGLAVCDLSRWMVGWNRSYWLGFKGLMAPRCEPTLRAIDGGQILASEDAYQEAIFKAFPV